MYSMLLMMAMSPAPDAAARPHLLRGGGCSGAVAARATVRGGCSGAIAATRGAGCSGSVTAVRGGCSGFAPAARTAFAPPAAILPVPMPPPPPQAPAPVPPPVVLKSPPVAIAAVSESSCPSCGTGRSGAAFFTDRRRPFIGLFR